MELVLVLTILGISASLVVVRPGAGTTVATDGALTRARRLAVSRAEVLRFEVRADGAWMLFAPDGTTLDAGRNGGAPLAVELDALGNCQPVRWPIAPVAGRAFDPLTCRYRVEGA